MVKINATIILSILCIIVSFYAWFSNPGEIFKEYGYSTINVLDGKMYVFITSIFLHSGTEHLVLNLLALLLFGFALEEEIGSGRFLLIFFLGAFLGNLFSSLFYSPEICSIGASGGIFAIMTATLLIKPIKMEVFMPIPLGIIALGYLITSLIGLITGYPPGVSHIAHMGGAFVGLYYGFKAKGLKRGMTIMIALFLIFLFVPIIWNLWVLIVKTFSTFL